MSQRLIDPGQTVTFFTFGIEAQAFFHHLENSENVLCTFARVLLELPGWVSAKGVIISRPSRSSQIGRIPHDRLIDYVLQRIEI